MFAVLITKHLLCKIFKLFVFQIEYASNIDITVILELLGDAFT